MFDQMSNTNINTLSNSINTPTQYLKGNMFLSYNLSTFMSRSKLAEFQVVLKCGKDHFVTFISRLKKKLNENDFFYKTLILLSLASDQTSSKLSCFESDLKVSDFALQRFQDVHFQLP